MKGLFETSYGVWKKRYARTDCLLFLFLLILHLSFLKGPCRLYTNHYKYSLSFDSALFLIFVLWRRTYFAACVPCSCCSSSRSNNLFVTCHGNEQTALVTYTFHAYIHMSMNCQTNVSMKSNGYFIIQGPNWIYYCWFSVVDVLVILIIQQ